MSSLAAEKVQKPLKLEIETIWDSYHQQRKVADRNKLMEHYRDLVRYTAERICAKMPSNVQKDDLISAGTFGLMDAIENYDPTRGVKFETYCAPRIKGSMLDELRDMDWVPRLTRSRQHQIGKVKDYLIAQLGRQPTNEEIAEEICLDEEEFERLINDSDAPSVTSLERVLRSDEKELYFGDTIQNNEVPVQKDDLLQTLCRGLSRAEKLLINLVYIDEMKLSEACKVIGLSSSRASQLHSSVMKRMKEILENRTYEELI